MFGKTVLALGATVALAGAANAHSITVLGANADAIACFRAADSEMRRPDALEACAAALRNSDLTSYDRMATFVNRGIVRFRLEDFSGAIGDFDEAMRIEPNQPDAMINRGITMLAAGHDVDQSTSYIERGLAGGPQRPWVGYYGRAVANELTGQVRAAYEDYRQASLLDPKWQDPKSDLARFRVR